MCCEEKAIIFKILLITLCHAKPGILIKHFCEIHSESRLLSLKTSTILNIEMNRDIFLVISHDKNKLLS